MVWSRYTQTFNLRCLFKTHISLRLSPSPSQKLQLRRHTESAQVAPWNVVLHIRVHVSVALVADVARVAALMVVRVCSLTSRERSDAKLYYLWLANSTSELFVAVSTLFFFPFFHAFFFSRVNSFSFESSTSKSRRTFYERMRVCICRAIADIRQA